MYIANFGCINTVKAVLKQLLGVVTSTDQRLLWCVGPNYLLVDSSKLTKDQVKLTKATIRRVMEQCNKTALLCMKPQSRN
jgi:hypothetical protein